MRRILNYVLEAEYMNLEVTALESESPNL